MSTTNKSKFLTFIFSFVPGLGHMYLGLINRGLQFMILFFGSIFLLDFLRIHAFPFVIPIIWFFSMFDALQHATKIRETGAVEDKPLIVIASISNKSKLWGWGLIGVGGYILLERVVFQFRPFQDVMRYLFGMQGMHVLRSVLLAAILIYVGWRLLTGKPIIPTTKTTKNIDTKSEGEEV
ncbi:hypothetical protein [Desulfuribacillus alkaliarsenatis]|uniref:TM2 domain-containing protein n=1 Tax=Desulfuribacillus alkaliarsenatis TaxID=766136 RepID=A0A1E5G4P7_9FIRM|nr:hypothetical protein [Desulfuribacillus alkaliarsenatis]OEF98146.1 hypothetical protein BHF68_00180 [Desulfuribacillus alkaliarsenatis]